jgi:hypothetical protein
MGGAFGIFIDTYGGAGLAALGLGQKPVVMVHYPHMMSEDIAVWSKYLADPVVSIKEVWYDVHVGAGISVPEGAAEIDRKIAKGVGCKRIDAVCRVGGGFWVVEIKPHANMGALGQIIVYTRLFIAEFNPDGEVWPVIVCDSVDEDLLADFDNLDVIVIVND